MALIGEEETHVVVFERLGLGHAVLVYSWPGKLARTLDNTPPHLGIYTSLQACSVFGLGEMFF